MPPGTPGFVGERLREAREGRGLTAISLADILGVTRAAISQYESGKGTPRPEIMDRICRILNLPAPFFSRPVSGIKPGAVFYRSMSAATKGARTRAKRRLQWLYEEIVPYLGHFVQLPTVKFPDVDFGSDPDAIPGAEVEAAASNARRFWGLGDGPISNVTWLLENQGGIVTRGELAAEELDSFSTWVGGRPYVFLNADKESAARSRFDVAHELGHLILHRNVDKARLTSAPDYRIMEQQANRFAGAFLLPSRSFAEDLYLPTLNALRALKPKWVVSIGAMIKRTEHLGIISPGEERRLWIAYARRGWKRREPLDDELPVEQPRLNLEAFQLLVNQAVQTRDDVLASVPFAPSDIEELAVLPSGYLSPPPPTVRLLKSHTGRPDDSRAGPRDGGGIIPFPTEEGRE